jgi:hypothetical protein
MSLRLSVFPSLSTLSLALILAACGGGDDDDDGDGPSASCLEAEDHSDLAWIQENIFNGGCALAAACHKGDAPDANGLNLEAGMSEANLVGVPAVGDSADGLNLVEPGNPMESYLLIILGHYGTDDPRIPDGTGPMPFNSPLLCEQKRDAIERWIESL